MNTLAYVDGSSGTRKKGYPAKPYSRGRLSTFCLFVLSSLDRLLFIWKYVYIFYKTSYLNEEVNCTEFSPSVSVPWVILLAPGERCCCCCCCCCCRRQFPQRFCISSVSNVIKLFIIFTDKAKSFSFANFFFANILFASIAGAWLQVVSCCICNF